MYEALADSLAFYCAKYNAKLAGYVFMPTHLHLLLFVDGKELGAFMRDFKKFTAQKAAKDLDISVPNLWMPRYDRVAIVSDEIFRVKLNYIHNNPVESGLSRSVEQWKWSSASDYCRDKSGPLEIWREWA